MQENKRFRSNNARSAMLRLLYARWFPQETTFSELLLCLSHYFWQGTNRLLQQLLTGEREDITPATETLQMAF